MGYRRSGLHGRTKLRCQRTITPAEDETGGRLEQCRVVRRYAGGVAQEHTARLVDQLCRGLWVVKIPFFSAINNLALFRNALRERGSAPDCRRVTWLQPTRNSLILGD